MSLVQPYMIHTFILSIDVIRSTLHDSYSNVHVIRSTSHDWHIHSGVNMILAQS